MDLLAHKVIKLTTTKLVRCALKHTPLLPHFLYFSHKHLIPFPEQIFFSTSCSKHYVLQTQQGFFRQTDVIWKARNAFYPPVCLKNGGCNNTLTKHVKSTSFLFRNKVKNHCLTKSIKVTLLTFKRVKFHLRCYLKVSLCAQTRNL